jgi:signal transduction histidine kinase
VKGILNTARTLLKDGLEETRNIVQLLDQDKSVKQSLAERLTQLAKGFESATGIVITLQLDCDEAIIPSHYKHHLLRIVQEALTNVSRHAHATEVTITLNTHNGIALSVEDNGVSLNQSQHEQLPSVKSIESRVAELNGKLNFIRNDTVTQLQVEIPLKAMSANNAD